MKKILLLSVLLVLAALIIPVITQAGIPQLIHYGARLTDPAGNPEDTTVSITFSIYADSTGGAAIWSETQPAVQVVNGLFSVNLGSMGVPPDDGIWLSPNNFLGVKVGGDAEISPRTRIATAPYAFRAEAVEFFNPGPHNIDTGKYTFVAGDSNTVYGSYGSITGGYGNLAECIYAPDTTIDTTEDAEGYSYEYDNFNNQMAPYYCPPIPIPYFMPGVIASGTFNYIKGNYSAILGGFCNATDGAFSTIGCGWHNNIKQGGSLGFVGAGEGNLIDSNFSAIAGGKNNHANATCSFIGCGYANSTNGKLSAISGGYGNRTNKSFSAVVGGKYNQAYANYSFVGGGNKNNAKGSFSTISGGDSNYVDQRAGTVGGGKQDTVKGQYGTIAGGHKNTVKDEGGTIGGGGENTTRTVYTTVAGGLNDSATAPYATVGGGLQNWAREEHTTIGGGYGNETSADSAVIAGGIHNTASGLTSAILGGSGNLTSESYSAIGGGNANQAAGRYSTIPGGYMNTTNGDYSLAAGRQAQASNGNSFVWNDGSAGSWATTGANQFLIHASGGVGIGTNAPISQLHVVKAISTSGEAAVTVNFSNSVGSIGARGIYIESTQLTNKGSQTGIMGKTSISYSTTQIGSSEGRLAEAVGFDAYGGVAGICGFADFTHLYNGGSVNSYGLGGKFIGKSTAGISLDGNGTYYVGGVYGEVNSTINAVGENAVVAGVIGVDKADGTSYHRAAFFDGVMRLKPMAAAPANPLEGDVYVNSTDHHIYCYLNGAWKQLDN